MLLLVTNTLVNRILFHNDDTILLRWRWRLELPSLSFKFRKQLVSNDKIKGLKYGALELMLPYLNRYWSCDDRIRFNSEVVQSDFIKHQLIVDDDGPLPRVETI